MFFVVSKVFWFFVQPLNLAIFFGLAGIAAQAVGRRRIGLWSLSLGTGILVLAVWTSLGAILLHPLEDRAARPELPADIDGIVVLGGGFEGAINIVRGGYELNAGGDRFVEAAVLARRYPRAKVVISGGSGTLMLEGETDAAAAQRLLSGLGIEPDRLVLEDRSRSTYENALFTRDIVHPAAGENWLLITSAFHMPRAMGLFRKAGFAVTPWPVDYRTIGKEGLTLFYDNPVDSLQTMTLAIREWLGLLAYRLSGRTEAILP